MSSLHSPAHIKEMASALSPSLPPSFSPSLPLPSSLPPSLPDQVAFSWLPWIRSRGLPESYSSHSQEWSTGETWNGTETQNRQLLNNQYATRSRKIQHFAYSIKILLYLASMMSE